LHAAGKDRLTFRHSWRKSRRADPNIDKNYVISQDYRSFATLDFCSNGSPVRLDQGSIPWIDEKEKGLVCLDRMHDSHAKEAIKLNFEPLLCGDATRPRAIGPFNFGDCDR
jgi:hypothetical protein